MSEIELDAAHANTPQAVTVGDELVLHLHETPTSGYRWTVEAFDETILAAREDSFTPPGSGPLGASGQRRLCFVVVGPGQTALRLALRRPWAPESVAERFETTIDASLGASSEPAEESVREP